MINVIKLSQKMTDLQDNVFIKRLLQLGAPMLYTEN